MLTHETNSAEDIRAAIQKSGTIPDVLDTSFSAFFSLSLSYLLAHASIHLGNTISPSAASSTPVFTISTLPSPGELSPTRTLGANKTYTLILTDPDATSHANSKMGQMCHWIVTGIWLSPTNASEGMDEASTYMLDMSRVVGHISMVKELVEYLAPGPPKKTGLHRYLFVLLASKGEGEGEAGKELSKPKERTYWGYGKEGKGVREWAVDNDLLAVGVNFFYAQHEKQ